MTKRDLVHTDNMRTLENEVQRLSKLIREHASVDNEWHRLTAEYVQRIERLESDLRLEVNGILLVYRLCDHCCLIHFNLTSRDNEHLLLSILSTILTSFVPTPWTFLDRFRRKSSANTAITSTPQATLTSIREPFICARYAQTTTAITGHAELWRLPRVIDAHLRHHQHKPRQGFSYTRAQTRGRGFIFDQMKTLLRWLSKETEQFEREFWIWFIFLRLFFELIFFLYFMLFWIRRGYGVCVVVIIAGKFSIWELWPVWYDLFHSYPFFLLCRPVSGKLQQASRHNFFVHRQFFCRKKCRLLVATVLLGRWSENDWVRVD